MIPRSILHALAFLFFAASLPACGAAGTLEEPPAKKIRGPAFRLRGEVVGYERPRTPEDDFGVRVLVERDEFTPVFTRYAVIRVGGFWWRDYGAWPPGGNVSHLVYDPDPSTPWGMYHLAEKPGNASEMSNYGGAAGMTDEDAEEVRRVLMTGPTDMHARFAVFLKRFGSNLAEVVARSLKSPSPYERLNAAVAAAWVPHESYVPSLSRIVGEKNPRLRLAAVAAAREIGREEAVPVLARGVQDSERDVRLAAFEGLGWMRKPEYLDLLSLGLGDENERIRTVSAGAVAALDSAEALNRLERAFLTEKNPVVRREILRAAACMSFEGAVMFFRNALKDRAAGVAVAAFDALGTRGEGAASVFLSLLGHERDYFRWRANEELERIYRRTVGYKYDAGEEERRAAMEKWESVIRGEEKPEDAMVDDEK